MQDPLEEVQSGDGRQVLSSTSMNFPERLLLGSLGQNCQGCPPSAAQGARGDDWPVREQMINSYTFY